MQRIVTITGADDAVDVEALCDLSAAFPFVEWGILYSAKREGSARYPSKRWRERLRLEQARRSPVPRLALHLCGAAARDVMSGYSAPLVCNGHYSRIQLNGYEPWCGEQLRRLVAHEYAGWFILQCRDEASLQDAADDAKQAVHASVLYDPSGGRGVEPFAWPRPPHGCHIGYAGGIGPDNVRDVLSAIGPIDYGWIDMESGVRDQRDAFDLQRVRAVLDHVAAAWKQGT